MQYSDCIIIEGSNFAECHPVGFRWVMKAKLNGAKIIHVDPRFTRTSALADIHAPIRAGSDIAFLGGLIRYVINDKRWQEDDFFQSYLKTYTNAATLINEKFEDTEKDLKGVFSGLGPYDGAPINGFLGAYNNETWQYARTEIGDQGRTAATGQSGEQPVQSGNQQGDQPAPDGPPFDELVKSIKKPSPRTDPTLQDPNCVFQLLKKHYERYTPEMVERVTGCPKEKFIEVAETLLANSGRDRTSAFAYAVAWTQHTTGPQTISCCAMLQLLLGNMGRPGAGVMALRGHATIQGSTDIPTLYHSIQGYMPAPSAAKAKKHDTLEDYLATETLPTSYWANMPKFLVSYFKSMYGDAATKDNDFGYDWHPKITNDHSHLPMFINMAEGQVKGMFCMGQNPAVGGQHAGFERRALAQLDWLVVKDNFETETAAFWYNSPEVKNGTLKTADIKTEVFFFPSNQVAEMDGSFTNTQRLVQWHNKAANAPGDCRSDMWFTYQLGKRLKALYADSTAPRDQGIKNLVWEYDFDEESEALKKGDEPSHDAEPEGEPDIHKILKEINGFFTDEPTKHLQNFGELKDDGSTTCANWLYSGIYPAPDQNNANRRQPDPPEAPGQTHLNWGFSWPANRRVLYNRASADPDGNPWSERKKFIWWDPNAIDPKTNKPYADPKTGKPTGGAWVGYDVPDFPVTKRPDYKPSEDSFGLDAHPGTAPFIMKADGKGWLFAPTGLVDGPLPTHYEPAESPVQNPMYEQQINPVLKYWKRDDNPLATVGDPRYPYVITTYRLTEHHLTGVMTRWLPWLAELQPELFIEMSPELAEIKKIKNLDIVEVSSPRATIKAKALVTRRMRPLTIDGKVIHHVGMPWQWGYQGVVTGDVVNDLPSLVGDPNVTIHEGKAFVCNVEKA